MSDIRKEILIKRKNRTEEQICKYMLLVGTVMMFVLGFLGAVLLFGIGGLMILVCYLVFPYFDIEYEYTYLTGSLDIDKIMGQRKRKRVLSLSMEKLILLAPSDSNEIKGQLSQGSCRKLDYTSGYGKPSWTMIMKSDDGSMAVKVELDEEIVSDINRVAPGKVKTRQIWE